jgi:molybdopterin-guanine dinucleotide biosynthesis protein A
MKYNLPAILFAGGKSSRMGEDKALLPFGGYPTLSEFQYQKLQQWFQEVHLLAKTDKFPFEASVILDCYQESSPLVGIVSIFETLQEVESLFILSIDAPFISQEVVERLLKQSPHSDATIAQSPQGIQPLCGIYRRSILPLAKQYLLENRHRLGTLLKEAHTEFVPFEKEALFFNLNHPHEYQEALASLQD